MDLVHRDFYGGGALEPAGRSLPCVYLGKEVVSKPNNCPGCWKRKCSLLGRDVSINADCKTCADYDAA